MRETREKERERKEEREASYPVIDRIKLIAKNTKCLTLLTFVIKLNVTIELNTVCSSLR